jgi:hypothetical protein
MKPFSSKIYVITVLCFILAGCSPDDWLAKFHMVKAEDYVTQAYQLKSKKVPYEKRLEIYKRACSEFSKAYSMDANAFTLMRIEEAVDACWKAENKLEEEKFKSFQETYIKAHPKEYEYGDSGASMMEMG